MISKTLSRLTGVIPVLGAAILFAMLLWTTRYGLGLSPDSTAYLKVADGLLKGHGLAFASVQWPPLYPSLLALAGYLGGDLMMSVRVLHALLIAMNFILIAQVLMRFATFTSPLAYLLAFLLSLHEQLLWVDFYVWSEPLLISLILVDLLLINRYFLGQSQQVAVLELILICIGVVAVMTRYAGLTVSMTNAIVVFTLVKSKSFYGNLIRASLQFIIPAVLINLWLTGHRAIDDGQTIERKFHLPQVNVEKLVDGLQDFGRFLYPSSTKFNDLVPNWVLIITGTLLLVAVFISIVPLAKMIFQTRLRMQADVIENNKLPLLRAYAGLFIVLYLAFFIFIIFCFDHKLILDNRTLSPIFIPVMLLILGSIASIKIKLIKNSLIILSLLALSCVYFFLRSWLLINYFDGVEINSRANINKSVYAQIKKYPETCQVYADRPWNIVLYFDTKVRWLPRSYSFGTGLINTSYDSELQALKGQTQVVLVESLDDPIISYLDSSDDFQQVYKKNDGMIWLNRVINQENCISVIDSLIKLEH